MSTQQSNAIQLSDTVEIPWNLLRKGAANVRVVSPEKADDAAFFGRYIFLRHLFCAILVA